MALSLFMRKILYSRCDFFFFTFKQSTWHYLKPGILSHKVMSIFQFNGDKLEILKIFAPSIFARRIMTK
ncbi:hypothetical protein DWX97_22490 [Bacteroides cellulosilyticus]|uniref:Uncharacterized protein n=1 Tax=Bacteroides cellulosilyticus TaxID=246787 RepID=A0A412I7U5_9BACE|nr:hypothetical protein DWX97_22490 [Bacteroides cellulosilyticus]